jgi:hypothetical protein
MFRVAFFRTSKIKKPFDNTRITFKIIVKSAPDILTRALKTIPFPGKFGDTIPFFIIF